MIEMKNLRFSYGDRILLDGLNLTLRDGELTLLLGKNGSGKTTLLRLILGELTADEGDFQLDGQEIATMERAERARRMSYFPQGRPIPSMTAREVVALGRYPYNRRSMTTPSADRRLADELLCRMGLERLRESPMKQLSYGERQQVYLAMLKAQDAGNCLFDEPTNFMDTKARFAMMRDLRQMAKEGRCVLCVSHDLPLAMAYADRILLLGEGKLLADGSPNELYENGILARVFGVRLIRVAEGNQTLFAMGDLDKNET